MSRLFNRFLQSQGGICPEAASGAVEIFLRFDTTFDPRNSGWPYASPAFSDGNAGHDGERVGKGRRFRVLLTWHGLEAAVRAPPQWRTASAALGGDALVLPPAKARPGYPPARPASFRRSVRATAAGGESGARACRSDAGRAARGLHINSKTSSPRAARLPNSHAPAGYAARERRLAPIEEPMGKVS